MKRSPMTHEAVFNDPAYAETYASHHQKMAIGFGNRLSKKLVSRGFKSGRILDAGCGSGATNLVLASSFPGSEVVGIDLSEPLLHIARQAVASAQLGERVRFEKGDVQQMPFDDRYFDVVININMAHLVGDSIRMLDEIERVLAHGGYYYICDLRRSWLGLVEKEISSGLSAAEARQLVNSSHLRKGRFSSSLLWWKYEASNSSE